MVVTLEVLLDGGQVLDGIEVSKPVLLEIRGLDKICLSVTICHWPPWKSIARIESVSNVVVQDIQGPAAKFVHSSCSQVRYDRH